MTTFSKALQTGPSNPGTEIEAPKYLCPKDIFVLIYVVRKLLCCLALQKLTDDHFSRKKMQGRSRQRQRAIRFPSQTGPRLFQTGGVLETLVWYIYWYFHKILKKYNWCHTINYNSKKDCTKLSFFVVLGLVQLHFSLYLNSEAVVTISTPRVEKLLDNNLKISRKEKIRWVDDSGNMMK